VVLLVGVVEVVTSLFAPASRGLSGSVVAPADKSISHRAALLAAMSDGVVRIEGYLRAADTLATLEAVAALGAGVEMGGEEVVVSGVGLRGARAPAATIDVQNSGTLLRLLPGWLAGQEGRTFVLDGDESIRRRPVDRIVTPLEQMGARLEATDGRTAPLTVHGGPLKGIEYAMPVASAQVKSAVLLAGLLADGPTTVIEPAPSRDHTERMLLAMGVELHRDGARITVRPADGARPSDLRVPGDPSSAAFLIAAATLIEGSAVTVGNVAANWTRTGFIEIARRMGAAIDGEIEPPGAPLRAHEPTTALEVTHSGLRGTVVEPAEIALAIDELPLVALLGCFAEGETVISGAQELRLKETDRIVTVVEGLSALGAAIEATDDGFVVRGAGGLRGGVLHSHGDHRLAMLGAIAGLASREGVEVVGMDAAAVSYPGFVDDVMRLSR
jgi:3-phosphoshikimate 1-carboxyvinyltransferase